MPSDGVNEVFVSKYGSIFQSLRFEKYLRILFINIIDAVLGHVAKDCNWLVHRIPYHRDGTGIVSYVFLRKALAE